MTNEEVVDALDEVWQSTLDVTADLSEDQWSTETPCPGWNVKDQLSHLIGIERSIEGDPAPTIALTRTEHLKNPIGEINEVWIEERRDRPGAEVRAEFQEVTAGRMRRLRATTPDEFEEIGWSPIGQVPLRMFLVVRVMDSWMHEQDIRVALCRPGGRFSIGERITLDRADAALGVVIGKGSRASEGSSVAIDVHGPQGGTRRLEVLDGRAVARDGTSATTTLRLSQESYVRRFGGRITSADVLEDPETSLEGDTDLGRAVLDALAVMP